MHSALKRDGKALYEYARAGIEVEREARRVTIHAIDIVDTDDQGDGDRWTIDVRCSKGTYIRTLAEDIGRALGCGAHLAALRRTGGLRSAGLRWFTALRRCRARAGRRPRCPPWTTGSLPSPRTTW
jgi:tRNA pseudouridine(55) synthase